MKKSEATKRFYEIVWPHRATVLRVARIQTGNSAEADDLAQETLLKAFNAIEHFSTGTNVTAWLLTILRNTRIDRLRTVARLVPLISIDALQNEPQSPAETVTDRNEAWQNPEELLAEFSDAEVIQALSSLSEDLRWTLLLVDVQGLNHSEAAQVLDVPVGTIKSRMHRGRAILRDALLPLARDRRLVSE